MELKSEAFNYCQVSFNINETKTISKVLYKEEEKQMENIRKKNNYLQQSDLKMALSPVNK